MSPIERLPTEIVQYIAELCTWDSAPPENGFPSEIDLPRYKRGDNWQPETYARYHAAFARTSHHFHGILNKRLYTRNLSRDTEFYSCLRWAVKHNRLETIKRAQEYGADLSSYGTYPHVEEKSRDRDIYIKVNGVLVPCSPSHYRKPGKSPLYHAASYGFSDIVEFLLEKGVKVQTESRGWRGYPLVGALLENQEKTAEVLVRHGAYLITPSLSALQFAFARGFQGIVKTLLQRKDTVTLEGKLHVGASSNDLKLVKQGLNNSEVNVNAKNYQSDTALHLAINSAEEKLDLIEFLLQQPGIQVSIPNGRGEVPIHLAANKGRIDIVRRLAKMPDFDVNCRTSKGGTVLHMAVFARSIEVFTYFLERSDLEQPQNEDMLKLLGIISRMSDDVLAKAFVELLLDSGVQLEPDRLSLSNAILARNLLTASKFLSLISQDTFDRDYGRQARTRECSPLHHALMIQHPHLTTFVGELLARGVNIHTAPTVHAVHGAQMDFIASPLFYATAFSRNIDCMKMLLDAGADTTSAVLVRKPRTKFRTMSMLSGLFSYVWGERKSIVTYPIRYPGWEKIPITEGMSELKGPILMLLQHGATLNKFRDGPSALSLVCAEAMESSSLSLLEWLTDNATTSNVSIQFVYSLLSEFPLVKGKPVQSEIHNILKGFMERLLREGYQD